MYEDIFTRPHSHTPDKVGKSDEPWLTRGAITILDYYLKKEMVCAEFGSGSSTIWIANRVKMLYSVEHDKDWYNKVKTLIPSNVDYRLVSEKNYSLVYQSVPDESFDLLLVDGLEPRIACVLASFRRVKIGGLLVVDNMEREHYKPIESLIEHTGLFELTKTENDVLSTYVWRRIR